MKKFLLFSTILSFFTNAHAIIRHHEIPDADYIKGAERYSTVGKLDLRAGIKVSTCTATLISIPKQEHLNGHLILTAAHCLENLAQPGTKAFFSLALPATKLSVRVPVVSYFLHRLYEKDKFPAFDIGIGVIYPPLDITPTEYTFDLNKSKINSILRTVGSGYTGRGDFDVIFHDKKLRLTESLITGYDSQDNTLITGFERTKKSNLLSGLAFLGDCGAPGFVEVNGQEFLVSMVTKVQSLDLRSPKLFHMKALIFAGQSTPDLAKPITVTDTSIQEALDREADSPGYFEKMLYIAKDALHGSLKNQYPAPHPLYDQHTTKHLDLAFYKEWIVETGKKANKFLKSLSPQKKSQWEKAILPVDQYDVWEDEDEQGNYSL